MSANTDPTTPRNKRDGAAAEASLPFGFAVMLREKPNDRRTARYTSEVYRTSALEREPPGDRAA